MQQTDARWTDAHHMVGNMHTPYMVKVKVYRKIPAEHQ